MNKSFGLDIGITSIKAVWLSYDKNGFLLKSNAILATPSKGMLSQSPFDEEEMANAIRKTVEKAKIPTKNVNVALPENQVYTKVVEMPMLSDKELALAIHWEAEQYIPIPLSDVSLAWMVLNASQKQDANNRKLKIMVVGAPTSLVNRYQKILTMAKLNVVAVETELLSILRVLTYQKNAGVLFPPTIVLSIGSISTALALIKDGIVILIYSIPVGGMAIDRALQADLGLSYMQAEEYKKAYGVAKGEQYEKVGKTVALILSSVLTELKKVFAFYSQQYKEDVPIQQILLSGGTAKLPGIDMFFAENTGIETVIANPWKTILAEGGTINQDAKDNASDYIVAIGLAMRKD